MTISTDPNTPMAGATPKPVSDWDLLKEEFRGHYEQSAPQKYHLALRGIEMIQAGIAELAKLGHTWVASEVWNNKVETDKLMAAERTRLDAEAKAGEEAKAKAFSVGQEQAQATADAQAKTQKIQPGSQVDTSSNASSSSKKGA